MPIRPPSINPWPDHVSPFSRQFRDLINSAIESLVGLLKLQPDIQRVIRESKPETDEVEEASDVVRGILTTVGSGEFNVTYSAESLNGDFSIADATPINRWANYAFLPAALDDECQLHINRATGEVVALVVWETPDDKICAVPPTVPV